MKLLFRAILTGFGLRLGAELAKQVSKRIFVEDEANKTDAERRAEQEAEDDELPGVNPEPPTFEEPPDGDLDTDLEDGAEPEAQAS